MDALALGPLHRLAPLAPLAARVIVGIIMAAHGLQKLTNGPAAFAEGALMPLGVPLPGLMAWVVTLTEVVGGVLLVLGLLSRLAAFALTVNLTVAILLVKLDAGLIAPMGEGVGYELDLALIAGFLVVLFGGPGPISADRALGLDGERRVASRA